MENAVAKPNTHRREEKLWSEIKSYQVATNNARILGVLDEGAKRRGDLLLIPFTKIEKVGEFIIVTE